MSLKVSRILHAGYIFECENTQIAFDPIFENPFSHNCYAFPNVAFDQEAIKKLKLDAIFISHFHDDHCSFESLNLLDRSTPIYMFCVFEEMFSLIRELGFKNVFPLKHNETIQINSIEVIPRRALDEDVDSLFQIKAGGVNVLNVVDSWIDEETLDLLVSEAPWDLILWPFQTMRELEVIAPSRAKNEIPEFPKEWSVQLKKLNPRFIVPSSCQFILESWSWYNHAFFPVTYKQFTEKINLILPCTEVIRLNPSVSIVLDQKSLTTSSALKWISPIGPQDVDYVYHNNSTPDSTAEIAKKFPALTENETSEMYLYCQQGLIEKYNSLDACEDEYFKEIRNWRLSVYDHLGQAQIFNYQLSFGKLSKKEAGLADWSTEISIAKLYTALKKGETLTSLYLRIENDTDDVDLIEDPLIRCLFTGCFAAYQKSQLERIKKPQGINFAK